MLLLIAKLIVAVFLIRFHVTFYRIGANPIVARLNQLTDPLVLPFRSILPSRRYDGASVLVAWIIAILAAFLITRAAGIALMFGTLVVFGVTWLNLVMYALFLVIIASWLQTDPRQPLLQIGLCCSDWIMAPVRRVIPPFGALDFSPIVVLLGISFAKQGLFLALGKLLGQYGT